MAAHPWVTAPAWLIAILPQGKPPQGQRSRRASAATHQPATANGQPGSRSSRRWPIASTPRMTVEATASASQAYQATFRVHDSSGKKKAMPKTSPTAERRAQATACERDREQCRARPQPAAMPRPGGTPPPAAARRPARRAAPTASAAPAVRRRARGVAGCPSSRGTARARPAGRRQRAGITARSLVAVPTRRCLHVPPARSSLTWVTMGISCVKLRMLNASGGAGLYPRWSMHVGGHAHGWMDLSRDQYPVPGLVVGDARESRVTRAEVPRSTCSRG